MAKIYQTPGVYIEERSAFPNSAVPVATAVPAFIGYTEKAVRDKKSLLNKPTKISSYGEYLMFFGGGPKTTLNIAKSDDAEVPYALTIKGTNFSLHSQMRMFFSNGGTDCYIVSVGNYQEQFDFTKLTNAIEPLLKEPEPTMLLIPDATTGVSEVSQTDDMNVVYQAMLKHCGVDMRSRFAITDVWMDRTKYATKDYDMGVDVERFRNGIGTNHLQWSATYFPWVHTTAISANEVNMLNLDAIGGAADFQLLDDADFKGDKLDEIADPAAFKTKYVSAEVTSLISLIDKALNQDVLDGVLKKSRANEIKTKQLAELLNVRLTPKEAADKKELETLKEAVKAAEAAKEALPDDAPDADVTAADTAITAAEAALKTRTDADETAREELEALENTLAEARLARTSLADDAADADVTAADAAIATAQTALDTRIAADAGDAPEGPLVVDHGLAKELHQALMSASSMYKALMSDVRKELNLLPVGPSMAGIYSMIDDTVGVYQSPANVSVGSVIKPAVNINSDQQEDLNMPLNGKAVNAIRSFPGKGTLVWGARTLDGNSQDWRYISVRRTVIFIEQSIKYAAEPYVFEPNTASTWSNMKAMLDNFLTNVWQSGALAGATAADAFSVNVGLGVTMTPVDILDGYMRISVKIAVTRPAEFIVITFEQKMQQS